jgi:FkbM family methyltransferase
MRAGVLSLLAQHPHLYKWLLLLKGRGHYNLDKVVFLSLVQDQDTVLDVGANLGYYTLLFSQIVGSRGAVHAFEPVPDTFARLADLISEREKCKNVHLNDVAIGDACSDQEIFIPANDFGQASLAEDKLIAKTTKSYVIPVTTIDTYVEERDFSRLDFVKIDVEGYELLCLTGAVNTLKKFQPLLYLEIYNEWSKKFNYSPPELVSFLEGIGYTDFYLVHDGIKRLVNAKCDLEPQIFARPANLICAAGARHSGRIEELPML